VIEKPLILFAKHFKQDVEELFISPSALQRARMKHREAFVADYTGPGRERVDRLPIFLSGQNVVKLVFVPKLHDNTAVTVANEISKAIDDWKLWDRITSLCFYTTALNTGAKCGECKRRKTSTLSLPPPYFGINTGTRLQHPRCFQIPKH